MLPRWMSETAAMRNDFTEPACLFMIISYSLITGITAFINPPTINRDERVAVIINDHLRNSKIFSPLIIPGMVIY